jgi:hypothetical protein
VLYQFGIDDFLAGNCVLIKKEVCTNGRMSGLENYKVVV